MIHGKARPAGKTVVQPALWQDASNRAPSLGSEPASQKTGASASRGYFVTTCQLLSSSARAATPGNRAPKPPLVNQGLEGLLSLALETATPMPTAAATPAPISGNDEPPPAPAPPPSPPALPPLAPCAASAGVQRRSKVSGCVADPITIMVGPFDASYASLHAGQRQFARGRRLSFRLHRRAGHDQTGRSSSHQYHSSNIHEITPRPAGV